MKYTRTLYLGKGTECNNFRSLNKLIKKSQRKYIETKFNFRFQMKRLTYS